MAHIPNVWRPEDVITSSKLNDLENDLATTSENTVYGMGGAQQSSDGIHSLSYINKGDALPSKPQVGDTIFQIDGNDFQILEWNGEEWVARIDPDLTNRIDQVLKDANENAEKVVNENTQKINDTIDEVTKEQIELALKDADFNKNAQELADKALADAKVNTAQVAKDTLDSANKNIADAKTSLNSGLQKEISDRTAAVSTLDTKSQGYAEQAKKDAISAADTADGTINKKIDETKSSLTSTISQNKQDTEGKITTAQSTATQALNGLSTKVSQTDYDKKTSDLSTQINTTSQTATQSKQDIIDIKNKNGQQDSRMTSIESDANGTKTTVSNLQKTQNTQSGSISTLQQRADGFDATVTKVNGLSVGARNYWSLSGRTLGSYIEQDGTIKLSGTGLTAYNPNYFSVLPKQRIIVTLFDTDPNAPTVLAGRLSYYDKDRNFLSVSGNIPITKGSYKYVVPDDVAYFRMSLFKYDDIKTKVEIGTLATDWTPAPEDVDQATAKAQLTADQATTAISNYKTNADGRITKAQSDITQTAKDVTTKVSQSDYDKRTGDLSTSVSKAQQTADSAVTTIGNYKTSNDNRVKATETSIAQNTKDITLRATSTDLDSAKKDYNAQIVQVKVNADSITNQVSSIQTKINSMGQVNQLANTEFNPDMSGWFSKSGYPSITQSNGDVSSKVTPLYGSGINDSNAVKIDTSKDSASTYTLFRQVVRVTPGSVFSLSWAARTEQSNQYSNLWIRFQNETSTPAISEILVGDWSKDKDGAGSVSSTWRRITNKKATNIVVPDNATYVLISFESREGMIQYLSQPMLVFDSTVGDYVPGAYNSNDKVAVQQVTIDGITDTVSKQGTNIDSVTKRVTTAEGTLSTATNNINGLQSSVTQTSNQIKTEITDRTKGDANTLQSSKDFTQSSITSYDKGVQTQLTQTANGILAQVESTNMVVNSEFDPLNGTFYRLTNGGSTGSQLAEAWSATQATGFADWPVVNGSRVVSYAVATWYTSALVTASAGKVFSASIVAGRSPAPKVSTALDYRIGFWDSSRKLLTTASAGNIIDGTAYKGIQKYVVENKTAPANTAFVSVIIAHSSANATDYITRPSLNTGAKASPYTPTYGTSSSSTVLSLFKDNWSIGIADNIGQITNGIAADSTSMNVISNKVVISSPETQITGTAWINSAMIKNASIQTINIADAAITSAKIAQLDVAKLTGNVSSFIQSNWNGIYGSTSIDGYGMTVSSGQTTTSFNAFGMEIAMSNGGLKISSSTKDNGADPGVIWGMNKGAQFTSFGFQSSTEASVYNDEMIILKTGSAAAALYNIGGGVAFNHNVSLMDNVYMKPGKGFFMEWGKVGKAWFMTTINSGIPAILTTAGAGLAFGSGGQLYAIHNWKWYEYGSSLSGSVKTDYDLVTGNKA